MAASFIEIEGTEYVVRRFGMPDVRRARTDEALRALRAEYREYLPGGSVYGMTPYMRDCEAASERIAEAGPVPYDPEALDEMEREDAAFGSFSDQLAEARERAAYGLDRDIGMEAYEDRYADLYADD